MNLTDAFDNPILLGGFYGTCTSYPGCKSAVVIGEAVTLNPSGNVGIRITQRRRFTRTGLEDMPQGEWGNTKKTVAYHAGTLFPVAPPIQLMQRANRVLACASLALIGDGEQTFKDFSEFMDRTHSKKD
jgi:hypothetical protein